MSKVQDMRKLMEAVGKLLPKKSILNEEGIDNSTGEHNLREDRDFFNTTTVNEVKKVQGEYPTTLDDFPSKGEQTDVVIHYSILGTYHPSTMEDPEEYPEVEYDEVVESGTGLDISAQFVDFMEGNDVLLQKLDNEIFAHEDEKSNHFKDDYEESSKPVPGKETVTEIEAPADSLYVEYINDRTGENPFMMQGQKYQFVNGKYPDGKTDIAVYAFQGDITYGYSAWKKMNHIKESATVSSIESKPMGTTETRDLLNRSRAMFGEVKIVNYRTAKLN